MHLTLTVSWQPRRTFSGETHDSFCHLFADATATTCAEENLALKNVVLKYRRRRNSRGRGDDLGGSHGDIIREMDELFKNVYRAQVGESRSEPVSSVAEEPGGDRRLTFDRDI